MLSSWVRSAKRTCPGSWTNHYRVDRPACDGGPVLGAGPVSDTDIDSCIGTVSDAGR